MVSQQHAESQYLCRISHLQDVHINLCREFFIVNLIIFYFFCKTGRTEINEKLQPSKPFGGVRPAQQVVFDHSDPINY